MADKKLHAKVPDWNQWVPNLIATLLLIQDGDQILLIEKKRGLGAGKVTGPGGKLEPGETAIAAAMRETKEEVGLTTSDLRQVARLKFQFLDGLALQVDVFLTATWSGELIETPEATPFWCPIQKIPFDRMWQDDYLWLPRVLAGDLLCGHFLFDEDTMLTPYELITLPPAFFTEATD